MPRLSDTNLKWALILSLGFFASLPGLLNFGVGYAPFRVLATSSTPQILLVVIAVSCALALKKPIWILIVPTVLVGSLLGLALTVSANSPTHTWLGDTFMHGRTTHRTFLSPSPWLEQDAIDLAYLKKGEQAAALGHPLRAPEGGYLTPITSKTSVGTYTTLRLASTPTTDHLVQTWRAQLALRSGHDMRQDTFSRASAFRPVRDAEVWVAVSAVVGLLVSAIGFWNSKLTTPRAPMSAKPAKGSL